LKNILSFAVVLILDSKPDTTNRILEKLFQIPEFSASNEEQLILELFWNAFSGRPTNTPWCGWDKSRLDEAKQSVDPESAKFYENWTKTGWI
jgi:hypothetical protein